MGDIRLTLRYFWHITKQYPGKLILSLLNIIQNTANGVLTPLMLGFATQKIANPQSVSLEFTQIFGLIIAWSIVGIICNRIAFFALNELETQGTTDINNQVASHILHESYEFHSRSFSGALISQATRLGNSYLTFMDTILLDSMRNAVFVLLTLITIAFYDLRLAGLMTLLAGIGIGLNLFMAKRRYPLQQDTSAMSSKQTAFLSDIISNAVTVKTFSNEQVELHGYDATNKQWAKSQIRTWTLQTDANNLMLIMANLMNIAVLMYGIWAIHAGTLSVAIFIAAQLFTLRITNAFWDISRIVRTLERVFGDAHEMVQILQQTATITDQPNAQLLAVGSGAVTFDNVTFNYTDDTSDEAILKNFTLLLKPGEKVGLVGKSGGGKSTITKLLLRFMDIQSGKISIDGQDIADVSQTSLRNSIAYVPQEPMLFHRSIAENIAYGKPNATEAEIARAAKLAYADEFINQLPHRYKTQVGERGVKLSGGQKQRIAIARAILKDAPILVLDEATSALDSESEELIQRALAKLMKGRTVLVIAHRLSTIQTMDRIAVIEKGKVLESGTHRQLLKKSGTYAKLWKHQSGGFLEEA